MTKQRLIDLLAMSRFANLPTVWSNGLLGVLVSLPVTTLTGSELTLPLLALFFSLSALYLGGCFLNDWQDAEFDRQHRSDRPIPAGRWHRKTILSIAVTLMASGALLAFLASPPSGLFALGLIFCILLYTKLHKTHPISFIFMAGARALIYPLAACTLAPETLLIPVLTILALALGLYILGISLTARSEATSGPDEDPGKLPIFLLCAPLALTSGPLLLSRSGPALVPFLLLLIVLIILVRGLRKDHDIGAFVSGSLAAIPLVDYLLIFVIAPHWIFLLIPPALAITAKTLQRIAPAT